MRSEARAEAVLAIAGLLAVTGSAVAQKPVGKGQQCRAAVIDGEVKAGEAFRRTFAPGLEFFLEPLPSGWIARVLEVRGGHEVRESHDWAEVATLPYRSVSPLLISTDWAFRAQDAAGWNPRSFRYAANRAAFQALGRLEDRVVANDPKATGEAVMRVMQQPEGQIELMDVALVPGTQDQSRMAGAVAQHFAGTPHEVVQGEQASPLGRLVRLRFRVRLDLPAGLTAAAGIEVQPFSCNLRPTG